MAKTTLKATSLKSILITISIIVVLGMFGLFYYARGWLTEYASDIEVISIDTYTNSDSANQAQADLDNYSDLIEKAGNLAYDTANYHTSLSNDINFYINKYNLPVASITNQSARAGLNISSSQSESFSIDFESAVEYDNLLRFLISLENHVPVINIKYLHIDSVAGSSQVLLDPIVIEVYAK